MPCSAWMMRAISITSTVRASGVSPVIMLRKSSDNPFAGVGLDEELAPPRPLDSRHQGGELRREREGDVVIVLPPSPRIHGGSGSRAWRRRCAASSWGWHVPAICTIRSFTGWGMGRRKARSALKTSSSARGGQLSVQQQVGRFLVAPRLRRRGRRCCTRDR